MYSKFWPKGGIPGVLHHYTETLVAFEYATASAHKPHSLIFVGGLGDGLATTSYTADLVHSLQPTGWSLFTLNVTSSYQSWGLGHLDQDTDEIAKCIQYVKEIKRERFGDGKVVLMGHSTGSQCVLHYLCRPNPHASLPVSNSTMGHIKRPPLDGAIMQAPVSDREAIQLCIRHGFGGKTSREMQEICDKMEAISREAIATGHPYDKILPMELTSAIYPANTPISCRRFLSLYSPDSPQNPTDDDLFSADLSDDQLLKTFGMIQKQGLLRHKLMVLYSGADQAVPDTVDKEKNLTRWKHATNHGELFQIWDQEHTSIIPNASHALSNDDQAEPRRFLVEKVLGYLQASLST